MNDQRKDHTDPKRPQKGTFPCNYRHITCLPMMGKILTTQIREDFYFSLISYGLFPKEQKDITREKEEQGILLCINKHILKES